MPSASALRALIAERAETLGFAGTGVAAAGAVADADRFTAWIAADRHGSMQWLADGIERRLDPRVYFPGCRSLIVVADAYWTGGAANGPCGRVSNYAWGTGDYHHHLLDRLRQLADAFDAAAGSESKAVVDTAPVLEKYWAAQTRLGWQGKHTNVLSRELGSWFFLGVILTTATLEPDVPAQNHCGTCTACLDACPTDAFIGPYELDARRCISYLTIEHRGVIDEAVRPGMGEHLFGCDICQQVCPWNDQPLLPAGPPYARDPAWEDRTPREVFTWTAREFTAATGSTPVHRARRAGLARNLAIVLGNRRDAEVVPDLTVALGHSSAMVREAAAWALGRIGGDAAHAALAAAAARETDAGVAEAIRAALPVG